MQNFRKWLKCALIRAFKTFCQTFAAMIPVNILIEDVNWWGCVSVSLTAAVISLLTSTYGLPECKNNTGDEKNDN